MPLYEFECEKCKNSILTAFKDIEKRYNQKKLEGILKKYKNIKGIQIVNLDSDKLLESIGAWDENLIEIDLYIDEGKILVLFYVDSFRFSELIFDSEDEKKVRCKCGEKKAIERVISSFSYTQDLSTNPPRPPGYKDLPKALQGKAELGQYVEEKDRTHSIKADNRYKHQYLDKSKPKLL